MISIKKINNNNNNDDSNNNNNPFHSFIIVPVSRKHSLVLISILHCFSKEVVNAEQSAKIRFPYVVFCWLI